MRTDCFAYQSDTCCTALTEMVCALKKCPFYKPRRAGKIYGLQHYVISQQDEWCLLGIGGYRLMVMMDGKHSWLRVADLRAMLNVNCNELVLAHTPAEAHMAAYPSGGLGVGSHKKNLFVRADYLERIFEKSRRVDRTMLDKLVKIFEEVKA